MSELTSINVRDLYDTDSEEEVERPSFSPLSSMSSLEATIDDEDVLVSDDSNENDDNSGEQDYSDTEEGQTTVSFHSSHPNFSDSGSQYLII